MAADCESCGQKVNEHAFACPHCGVKRTNVAPAPYSKDEVRALLTTDSRVVDESGRSLAASLLFPHPQTVGTARAVEIVLTIACAPLVLVGTAVMMMTRSRRSTRNLITATRGEASAALVMTLFGATTFYAILGLGNVPAVGLLTLASVGCLWTRAYVRSRSEAWKPEDLAKLPKVERTSVTAPRAPRGS